VEVDVDVVRASQCGDGVICEGFASFQVGRLVCNNRLVGSSSSSGGGGRVVLREGRAKHVLCNRSILRRRKSSEHVQEKVSAGIMG
jgi:hypothetical protein